MPDFLLVPISEAPAEAERLLIEWGEHARESTPPVPEEWVRRSLQEFRSGQYAGAVLMDPEHRGTAFVRWYEEVPAGRRAWVYLAREHRTPETLSRFLELSHDGTPVLSILEDGLGLDYGLLAPVLHERGYFRVSRIDMTYPRAQALPPATSLADGFLLRQLRPSDVEAVAHLNREAYADDPIEQALFWRREDRLEDARDAMRDVFGTVYGRWLAEASFGVWAGDRLAAATLVNDFHGPLITEVMVLPPFRRRGLARILLRRTLEAIRGETVEEPRLVVTRRNGRALALYHSVGFVPKPESEGGVWLNLGGLRMPRPNGDDRPPPSR